MRHYFKKILLVPLFVQLCLTSLSVNLNHALNIEPKDCSQNCIKNNSLISEKQLEINSISFLNQNISSFNLFTHASLLLSLFSSLILLQIIGKNKNWYGKLYSIVHSKKASLTNSASIFCLFQYFESMLLKIKICLSLYFSKFYKNIYSPYPLSI